MRSTLNGGRRYEQKVKGGEQQKAQWEETEQLKAKKKNVQRTL